MATPAVVGSNCTFRIAVWPGFKVSGKVAPEMEKPVPVTVAALTATGAVPVEVRVSDRVAGVFNATLPKAMLVALMFKVGVAALSCREKLSVALPAVAVSVAV